MIERIYWPVPGRIVAFEVVGEVTLQVVRELIQVIHTTLDASDLHEPVDVFLDVTGVTRYHPDTMNITKLFGAVKANDRVRWNVIINPRPHPVLDFVIRTVCQLFKTQLALLPTIDDALDFIQSKSIVNKV
jgi:hypothetical protein